MADSAVLTVDNALDNPDFKAWWDRVHDAIRPEYCWDDGVMLEALINLFNEGENPVEAAKVAVDDYEQGQGELRMAIPSWDR